ncbi:TetR family transcriptional regulator [Saccharopolyspora erythraea NRRL 2338]|uniref:TetR family transcriptional regulatory protein n=2 Tax=Saccharopolyspora erythraea TaxID=1836 RepID=A4FD19_SACEN|nr:TetR/AcrR family transcriptional regulator C-terminal domain-containing protein [Saccharopolyspora erythraea]EQD83344.1 TetR family transcriptional regulator [Saccharopolyspora erythraea D]PFG95692.1 TetR family transcriptional regulator [Saccharopolyspora erythraea NRRL 2338]QRK92288.1 TetR/AcrR family transcriptional regulator C-terminal domain-containing protein [Saccharopolyspora erythraea]CAM01944.1 TetR family transcriptional regulatory protein [Saccharopolyspora erythraea NRRL 2338]
MAQGSARDPDLVVELLWRDGDAKRVLSLERIVQAAVEVADGEGLSGLSMRKVAERLGFTGMSLYRHVPGRDALVELMCDAVLGGPPEDPVGGGWRSRLEEWARKGWELRKRHPWLAEVRGTRQLPGPNGVAHYEHVLGILAGTGLAPAEVVAAVNLVGRFVDAEAAVLVEAARAERSSGVGHDEWWAARGSLYAWLDRYPTLTALWEAGGFDESEDPFEFGLARVLDGIELLVGKRDEMRDEMRDGMCQECGEPVERQSSGRTRAYCSRACQQRAYRKRKSG